MQLVWCGQGAASGCVTLQAIQTAAIAGVRRRSIVKRVRCRILSALADFEIGAFDDPFPCSSKGGRVWIFVNPWKRQLLLAPSAHLTCTTTPFHHSRQPVTITPKRRRRSHDYRNRRQWQVGAGCCGGFDGAWLPRWPPSTRRGPRGISNPPKPTDVNYIRRLTLRTLDRSWRPFHGHQLARR